MMLPVRILGATRSLARPESMTKDDCSSLWVKDIPPGVHGGFPIMESAWEPDDTQRLDVASGASIVLGIVGFAHPPVYLRTGETPERFRNGPTAAEALAIIGGVRDVLNTAGAAITEPREILAEIKRLVDQPLVRAMLGTRQR